MNKTATGIMLADRRRPVWYPRVGFDPLQEFLAGTFYETMAKKAEWLMESTQVPAAEIDVSGDKPDLD